MPSYSPLSSFRKNIFKHIYSVVQNCNDSFYMKVKSLFGTYYVNLGSNGSFTCR
jgi:hypothetical protein